jgi:hypothetical protein
MCFNGAKTYQLGWYSQYHLDLPISKQFNRSGNLIGFAEKANASSDDNMIIRIIAPTEPPTIIPNAVTAPAPTYSPTTVPTTDPFCTSS